MLDQSIGTELIRDMVAEFAVSVIVVLGHERLYNDMVRRYGDKSGVAVVKLARSGGAVELNDTYVQQLQNYHTKQYFYGDLKNVLSPVSRTLDFKNIKVYRLAEGISLQIIDNLQNRERCNTCFCFAHWTGGVCHRSRDSTRPARISDCSTTFHPSYHKCWN